MNVLRDAVTAISGGLVLVALLAVAWWVMGALAGIAYQGFKFVTG